MSAQRDVAEQLDRFSALLADAAQKVRSYALRAAEGDAGSVEDGQGYHFLVSQALREVLSATSNMPISQAFQSAADADRHE